MNVKETLAKRVGFRCSNTNCRKSTAGPREEADKSVSIGVAAHITAAAPGGPRYDASLSAQERSSIENAIWLCQNCAKLVDNDPSRYTVEKLHSWKQQAEEFSRTELVGTVDVDKSSTALQATVEFDWKRTYIEPVTYPTVHEYLLLVIVENIGNQLIKDYYVELEMPTIVLESYGDRVSARSDDTTSLFRKACADGNDDIYPGNRKTVMQRAYFVNNDIFNNRANVFELDVRARLCRDSAESIETSVKFKEIQHF